MLSKLLKLLVVFIIVLAPAARCNETILIADTTTTKETVIEKIQLIHSNPTDLLTILRRVDSRIYNKKELNKIVSITESNQPNIETKVSIEKTTVNSQDIDTYEEDEINN